MKTLAEIIQRLRTIRQFANPGVDVQPNQPASS
jgi:hypothetical protein